MDLFLVLVNKHRNRIDTMDSVHIAGSNLQALIDYTRNPHNNSSATIVLVISNKAGVKGLERAYAAGIETKVRLLLDCKSPVKSLIFFPICR